jgi:hypothetical protein
MYQGYGQTELLPVAMMGPRQWFARCLSLSCSFGTRTTNPCSAKRDCKMRDGVKTARHRLDRADEKVNVIVAATPTSSRSRWRA